MPYVHRDGGAIIIGLTRWPVSGAPVEFLSDDDPEVVAFQNPPELAPETTPATADDLERALIDKGVLTATDIETAKKTRVL